MVSMSITFFVDGRYITTFLADLKNNSSSPLSTRWPSALLEIFDLSAIVKSVGCSLGNWTDLPICPASEAASVRPGFSVKYLNVKTPPVMARAIKSTTIIDMRLLLENICFYLPGLSMPRV